MGIVTRCQSGTRTRVAFTQSTSRAVRTWPACITRRLCRDRRLIQPTTVGPPAILTDTRPCAVLGCVRFRRPPAQPRVRAITVKVALELTELRLQISGRPEQRPVETFAAYRADQPFDEGMRQWRV